MRTREVPAGPASAHGRPTRRTVLLTTEGGTSSASADLAADVGILTRGLSEIEFVRWTLAVEPGTDRPPANVVQTIEQPAWNAPLDAVFGTRPPRRRRPSARDVERGFVPALRAFL